MPANSPAPLPTWCREGETAVVIYSGYETGIGSYPVLRKVTITRVTATQVRVQGPTYQRGNEVTFVRETLQERGSYAGSSTAPRLYDPTGPEAHGVARQVSVRTTLDTVIAEARADVDQMRRDSGKAHVALDVTGTINRTVANLDDLIKHAIAARNTLIDLKEN